MVKPNLVTGKMESLTFQAHGTPLLQFLLLVSIIPKYSMQCRFILYVNELFPLVMLNILSCWCLSFYVCRHGVPGISVWNQTSLSFLVAMNILFQRLVWCPSLSLINFAWVVFLIGCASLLGRSMWEGRQKRS